MKKIKISLIISIALILMLSNLLCIKSLASFNITSAHIYSKGDCGQLIKKDGTIVKTEFTVYLNNGVEYPAYCLDKTKAGVGKVDSYTVNIEKLETNVAIWRAITNGYPYKSPADLGCDNEKQAFVATKMAVYSIIYGYNIEQFEGIGKEGENVVNAINSILNKGLYGKETKISPDLTISQVTNKLYTDNLNSKYISQIFKVNAQNTTMKNYTVKLEGSIPEGTLVTDENNNKKEEFSPEEKFKILIPIDLLGEGGEFKIKVESGVSTKPIFYGTAPDSSYQDYALTAGIFEDGVGEATLTYSKNETKLKIYKKDTDTQEVLTGARFDLLDSEKNVIYANLISDEEGLIILNNLLPGTYYLKETKAPTDYQLYEEYIKLDIGFNEEISVIVNNTKGEKPKVEVEKNKIEVKPVVNKLPKTGM